MRRQKREITLTVFAALFLYAAPAPRAGLVLDIPKPLPGGMKGGWDNIDVQGPQEDKLAELIPESSKELDRFQDPDSRLPQIDLTNFKEEVKQSSLPVLLFYCAPRIGLCAEMRPFIEELADRYKGNVKFAEVDVTKDDGALRREGVIPHFYLYKDGSFSKMKLLFTWDKAGPYLHWDIAPGQP